LKKENKALGPQGKKRSATTELNGTPSKLKKQVPVKLEEAEAEEHESSDGESETEVEIPKGTKVGKLNKNSPKSKESVKAGFKIEKLSDNENDNEKEEDLRGKKRNATTNESNEKSPKLRKKGKAAKLKRKSQTVVFDEASFSTSDNDD